MIQPVGNYLLVKPEEFTALNEPGLTKAGIVVVHQNENRQDLAVAQAEVISVGAAVTDYRKGQKVLYNYFSGNQWVIPGKDPLGKDDQKFHLVFADDILAIVTDK